MHASRGMKQEYWCVRGGEVDGGHWWLDQKGRWTCHKQNRGAFSQQQAHRIFWGGVHVGQAGKIDRSRAKVVHVRVKQEAPRHVVLKATSYAKETIYNHAYMTATAESAILAGSHIQIVDGEPFLSVSK